MASYLHLLSNSDVSRFSENEPGTFTTRLQQPLILPKGARVALEEISLQCAHTQDESAAKMEIIDWLFPIYEPEPPTPEPPTPSPTPTPIPVKPKRKIIAYGKKFVVNLSKIDVANGQQLVALINGEIWKVMPRAKQLKADLFSFNKEQNSIYLEFPKERYYFTIILYNKLLELLGMTHHTSPSKISWFVVGETKPSVSYQYKKGAVVETRKFDKSLADEIVSKEQRRNFFLYPPKLQSVATAILCYMDVVELQYFANTQIPLLRVFQSDATNARVTKNFGSALQFVPLRQNKLEQLTIYLRDLYGQPLNLTSYTRVTLAIRGVEGT